jgi:hypothetical protein
MELEEESWELVDKLSRSEEVAVDLPSQTWLEAAALRWQQVVTQPSQLQSMWVEQIQQQPMPTMPVRWPFQGMSMD